MRSKTMSLGIAFTLVGAATFATGTSPMPQVPSAQGQGDLAPCGGDVPSRWRPEAILANAASALLNEMWALPDVRDVIVAAPVHMLQSDFREFGDGQANAAPTTVHFKFVKMSDDRSSVEWQSGDNRSVSTSAGSFSGDF